MFDILISDCFFYFLLQTGDVVIAIVLCAPQG